jgi:hypothetical protein
LNACPVIGGFGEVVNPLIVGGGSVTVVTTIVAVAVFESPALFVTFNVIVCDAAANGKLKLGREPMPVPLLRHS